jgi:hypothetical protein
MKTMADAQNLGGEVRRKTSAENLGGKPMPHIIYDRTKAEVEISAPGKVFARTKKLGGKVLRLSKVSRKSPAPSYYLGSAESPTADFL